MNRKKRRVDTEQPGPAGEGTGRGAAVRAPRGAGARAVQKSLSFADPTPAAAATGSPDETAAGSPPDQAAREQISRDLDSTMLVEAAAGTGKTTKMVDRMVGLLEQAKCSIDRLAAVTFTRKAAAELRDRFQVELERRARTAAPEVRTRLLDALAHIEQCVIGTIHSFCGRLLRERPVEAGVDIAFEEIDEEVDRQIREQAWQEFVARLYANRDPVLDELDSLGLEIGQLREAFQKFSDFPDVQEWPARRTQRPDLAAAAAQLRSFLARISELGLPDDYDGSDALIPKYLAVLRLARWKELDKPDELMDVLEKFDEVSRIRVTHWPGKKPQALREQQEWNQFCRDVAEPLLRYWRACRYEVAIAILARARDLYDELRTAARLNFQDLLSQAAALLRSGPHVRSYFRNRFTHLLVDEFQDTDPIQAEVMLLLTADDPTESDWRKCRPAPGSLFVVGDPKQSIYRFRRADITTYNRVRDTIARCGKVVALTANFRTIDPVREWVNGVFRDVFPAAGTDEQARHVALEAGRRDVTAGVLNGIRVLWAPPSLGNQDDIAEYESRVIAQYIRHAVDSRWTVPRSRKELDASAQPQANYGDFLIVTPTRTRMSVYARALQELDIPHEVTGGSALNEARELALLAACLRTVIEPDNSVALVAVLRGELFGVSDRTLYAFHAAGGRFSLYAPLPEALAEPDRAALADPFARLRRYANWIARLPAPAAIEKIVADLGIIPQAAASHGGDVQAGAIVKAVELLRSAHAVQWTVADLIDHFEAIVERETGDAGYDAVPVHPHAVPATRIMNLHKAKGLEAPVVFLADPSGDAKHPLSLCVDRSGDRVVAYLSIAETHGYQRTVLAQPADWDRLVAGEQRYLDAEKDRLRYVAATRAGTQLTISLRSKRGNVNTWRMFERRLVSDSCPVLEQAPESALRPPDGEVLRSEEVTAAVAAIDRRWSAIVRPSFATAATKAVSVDAKRLAGGSEHGTEWGTVIHSLLEAAMRRPGCELLALARAELEEIGMDPALAADAAQVAQAVTRSEIWSRARRASRWLAEVPFQILLAPEHVHAAGLPTILRGTIDLVFEEPAGWVIVDYKTDHDAERRRAELVAHYRGQLEAYADAWQTATGLPVAEYGLYFVSSNQYVACHRADVEAPP